MPETEKDTRRLEVLRDLAKRRAELDCERQRNLVCTAREAREANEQDGISFDAIAEATCLTSRRVHQLCREYAPSTRDPKPGRKSRREESPRG